MYKRQLLASAGLTPEDLEDPLRSLPLNSVIKLFDIASKRLGDPCFGVNISENVVPGGAGLLSQLVLRAPDVKAGLQLMAQFAPIFMTQLKSGFVIEDGVGYASWRYPDSVSTSRIQFNIYIVSLIVRRLIFAIGQDWRPLAVTFDHRAPDCDQSVMQNLFGSRIRFEQPSTSISVDAKSLTAPMPSADPVMLAMFLDLAKRWIDEARKDVPSMASATRSEIAVKLSSGNASLDRIAAAMGQSPRKLQWRLSQAGTTFEAELNEVREDMARHLLLDTNRQISDIAMELGYGEASAFTRAAKRWFGMSPRAFRQAGRSQ